jgi:hypothetical protein
LFPQGQDIERILLVCDPEGGEGLRLVAISGGCDIEVLDVMVLEALGSESNTN